MFEALNTEERRQAVEACKVIKAVGRAHTSTLQRRMRIGYLAASHIMDCLEEAGIVGPFNPQPCTNCRTIYADKLEAALNSSNQGDA